jgi:uncharacterized membrane protein
MVRSTTTNRRQATPEPSDQPSAAPPRARKRIRPPAEYGLVGIVVGLTFVWWSLSPSLLPRGPMLQAAVSGVVGAIGYGLGSALGELVQRATRRDPSPEVMQRAWQVVAVVGPLVTVALLAIAARQQLRLYRLLAEPAPPRVGYLATLPVALLVAAILIQLARGVRWLARWLTDRLDRHLARGIAKAISVVLVAVLLIGLLDGIVARAFFTAADGFARAIDQAIPAELDPPTSPLRSGGPGSQVTWDQLGAKGREFVADGPTVVDLVATSARPAQEPIRVYVGLKAAEDDRARADLAVEELERTGAFGRSVLVVTVPTGTGWINPRPIDALEYLHAGDTAVVAVQYSYLPSWLSFLVDVVRAEESAREVINAVHARWEELPEGQRPLLLVYGESLGAYGADASFSGVADLRNRTDGALLIGPPNFSPLWRSFVEQRDPGSPERQPLYDEGRTVRFAASADALAVPATPWERPRVVYLQQASDPVVWWTPRLLLRRPDWLREPRAPEVLTDVHWFPVVTFAQITVDLLNGYTIDLDGYGHRYGGVMIDAWLAIAPPPDWDDADRAGIEAALGFVDR